MSSCAINIRLYTKQFGNGTKVSCWAGRKTIFFILLIQYQYRQNNLCHRAHTTWCSMQVFYHLELVLKWHIPSDIITRKDGRYFSRGGWTLRPESLFAIGVKWRRLERWDDTPMSIFSARRCWWHVSCFFVWMKQQLSWSISASSFQLVIVVIRRCDTILSGRAGRWVVRASSC